MMHPIPNKNKIHRAAIRTIVKLPINERIPGPNADKRRHQHAHEKHADALHRSCNATVHTPNDRAHWREGQDIPLNTERYAARPVEREG